MSFPIPDAYWARKKDFVEKNLSERTNRIHWEQQSREQYAKYYQDQSVRSAKHNEWTSAEAKRTSLDSYKSQVELSEREQKLEFRRRKLQSMINQDELNWNEEIENVTRKEKSASYSKQSEEFLCEDTPSEMLQKEAQKQAIEAPAPPNNVQMEGENKKTQLLNVLERLQVARRAREAKPRPTSVRMSAPNHKQLLKSRVRELITELEEELTLLNHILDDNLETILDSKSKENIVNLMTFIDEQISTEKLRGEGMEQLYQEEARDLFSKLDAKWMKEKELRNALMDQFITTLRNLLAKKQGSSATASPVKSPDKRLEMWHEKNIAE